MLGAPDGLEPLCARLSMDDDDFSQWRIDWARDEAVPICRQAKIAKLAEEGIVVE